VHFESPVELERENLRFTVQGASVIGGRCKNRLLAPGRKYFEDITGNKERDRKMNDHWLLRVSRKKRGFEIERIR
jgi:hypothetical protein